MAANRDTVISRSRVHVCIRVFCAQVGQELSFRMKVVKSRGIPKRFKQVSVKFVLIDTYQQIVMVDFVWHHLHDVAVLTQSFAKYRLEHLAQAGEGKTAEVQGTNPDYNTEKIHTYKTVTSEVRTATTLF